MPITRSGYATHRRNGSTRAYRKHRALTLAGATHCHICGHPPTPNDPLEADHIFAYADFGQGPLRPAHRSCNNKRGRAPAPVNTDNTNHMHDGGVI
jgi:hypothetical protein